MTAIIGPFQRRPRAALLVAVPVIAALLGAALAWVLRDDSTDSPRPVTVAGAAKAFIAGDLRLALPEGWKQVRNGGPVVTGFDRAHTTYLSSLSTNVAVAMLPPASATLLPAPLATGPDGGARRAGIVHAGRITAYHYVVAPQPQKSPVDVYVVPTTLGNATVACTTSVFELGECQEAVAALRLARGSFLKLSDQAAFLERLPAVVARLNHDRAVLRTRLARATTADGSSRIATRLADIYHAAGSALRPLLAPTGPARETVRLLDRLRAEHASLALALSAHDSLGFGRAAGTIKAHERALASQLAVWQRSLPQ
jgi:hypothetical protein